MVNKFILEAVTTNLGSVLHVSLITMLRKKWNFWKLNRFSPLYGIMFVQEKTFLLCMVYKNI